MKRIMVSFIWSAAIFSFSTASGQECKVLAEIIRDNYSGECKKGLAHGQGIAKGQSITYEGEFKMGFPDGQGTLRMEDGSVFTGEWKKGEVYGPGELVNAGGEKVSGYFKGPLVGFRLMGKDKASLAGYKVISTERLDNATYTFIRSDGNESNLAIKIFENNIRQINNFEILEITSGVIRLVTNLSGRLTADIIDINYPITIGIRYILPYGTQDTSLAAGVENMNSPRLMRFTITEPGNWIVTITHR